MGSINMNLHNDQRRTQSQMSGRHNGFGKANRKSKNKLIPLSEY